MSAPGATWPATSVELREAKWRPIERGPCALCGQEIVVVQSPAGGTVPLEQVSDVDDEARRYRPHLSTCLETLRRRKGPGSAPTITTHAERE